MEESKDVTAEGGLSAVSVNSAECGQSTAGGLNMACKPSAERVKTAASGLSTESGLCAEGGPSAENGLRAGSEQLAASGLDEGSEWSAPGRLDAGCEPRAERRLRASGGVHTVGRQRTERRRHVPDGLRTQDGVWVTGAYAPHCDQCRKPILRLETYIAVGGVTLCDGCYMNMGTREFLAKIGGELRVME